MNAFTAAQEAAEDALFLVAEAAERAWLDACTKMNRAKFSAKSVAIADAAMVEYEIARDAWLALQAAR